MNALAVLLLASFLGMAVAYVVTALFAGTAEAGPVRHRWPTPGRRP